jgi:hypothetical protein
LAKCSFINFAFNFAVLDHTGLLTPAQRTQFVNGLYKWCQYSQAIGTPAYTGGFRTTDQDQTEGQYFGSVLTYLATKQYNPHAGDCIYNSVLNGGVGTPIPIGGIQPTSGPSIRNLGPQTFMGTWSAGGVGPESAEYNYNTPLLVTMGVEEARILSGDNTIYPEFDKYIRDQALEQIQSLTPDLADMYAWGDDEWGRYFAGGSQRAQITTLGLPVAGVLKSDAGIGRVFNKFLSDHIATFKPMGWLSDQPWPFAFYHADKPALDAIAASTPDWRTLVSSDFYAQGMGMTNYHQDWTDPNSSFLMIHTPPRYGVDHEVAYFMDFGLYRNGEWVISHDIHYGGSHWNNADNSLTVAGEASMWNRGLVAMQKVSGKYLFVDAETSGLPFDVTHYWGPPPVFDQKTRRAMLYMPSASKQSDVIVDVGYINAQNPKTLPLYNRYYPSVTAVFDSAAALKQWWIHTPTLPQVNGHTVTYTTAKGQVVRTSVLMPVTSTIAVTNEAQQWASDYGIPAAEKKYNFVVNDNSAYPVSVFLNVIGVTNNANASVTAQLMFQTTDFAYVDIKRTGEANDTVLKIGLAPTTNPGVTAGSLAEVMADYAKSLGSQSSSSTALPPGLTGSPNFYDVRI